jgi:hypothetical protein
MSKVSSAPCIGRHCADAVRPSAVLVVGQAAIARQARMEVVGVAGGVVGIGGTWPATPGRRGTPWAAGPQVVAVELLGLAVTPCGAHQPPEDGPLSQRTVLKPSSSTLRLEKAPDSSQPNLRSWLVSDSRKAMRGSVFFGHVVVLALGRDGGVEAAQVEGTHGLQVHRGAQRAFVHVGRGTLAHGQRAEYIRRRTR